MVFIEISFLALLLVYKENGNQAFLLVPQSVLVLVGSESVLNGGTDN